MSGTPAGEPRPLDRLTRCACILVLSGLFFTLLHLVHPRSWSFVLFMVLGQGAIGAGMLCYGAAVVRDLRARRIL